MNILELLQSEFYIRAMVGGTFIGIVAPLIGNFLVLRRLAMTGDTLAHVTIAGVALGFMIGVHPLLMGFLFSIIASFVIEYLRKKYSSYAELSIAIMMSLGVALTSLFYTMGKSINFNVTSYLFGSIYTLDQTDLWVMGLAAVIVIAFLFFFSKYLFFLSFDEEAAIVNGLPVKFLNILMTLLTALVVSVSIKIVGALLVSALLVLPASCSLFLSKSFKQSMLFTVLIGELAIFCGLIVAGIWNLAPGATIVLVLISFLFSVLAFRMRSI